VPLDVDLGKVRQHELQTSLHFKIEQALEVYVWLALFVSTFLEQVLDQRLALDAFLQLFFDHGKLRSISLVAEDSHKFAAGLDTLDLAALPNVSAKAQLDFEQFLSLPTVEVLLCLSEKFDEDNGREAV